MATGVNAGVEERGFNFSRSSRRMEQRKRLTTLVLGTAAADQTLRCLTMSDDGKEHSAGCFTILQARPSERGS